MKSILVILAMVLAVPALAQDGDSPVLEVTFDETDAVPGQSLTLRLTVYVPTFMPTPPVWPSLEAPNLAVRLPARSTGPVSKPIGGETWSGVSRRYMISPMVPGDFRLPPQQILVTYNDPATSAPVKATLMTEPIVFRGIVPDGAEGLDPFIAATGLTLEETIGGTPGAMTPGESVTRTLTAKIEGTPSMFLPQLLPEATIAGLAAYPAEPVTMDTEARGAVTGTRTESVTYVAEGGGSGTAPAVRLDWYNLSSKAVETASVDGFAVSVDGPPVRTGDPRDPRILVLAVVAALVAAGLVAFALRRLVPGLRRRWTRRRVARLASERYAYRRLKAAIDPEGCCRPLRRSRHLGDPHRAPRPAAARGRGGRARRSRRRALPLPAQRPRARPGRPCPAPSPPAAMTRFGHRGPRPCRRSIRRPGRS